MYNALVKAGWVIGCKFPYGTSLQKVALGLLPFLESSSFREDNGVIFNFG